MEREGLSRRELMRLSAAGVLGAAGTGWFHTLSAHAGEAAAAPAAGGKRHKSCILLWMAGGPTHMDTFDLKPASKNAGEFKPIDTSVPGIQISEHLPKLAKLMGDMVLLRGMSTSEGAHQRGRYFVHTGYREGVGGVTYPSMGSIVSAELGRPEFELPNYVAVNGASLGAGFLGPKHAPLNVSDPSRGVENLRPVGDMAAFDKRVDLLEAMEKDFHGQIQAPSIKAHNTAYDKAVSLMHSPKAKAFDLSVEPTSVKALYGEDKFSQGCLLARRLVEVGVPFVEVSLGGWDTHSDNWEKVKKLSAQVDAGMSGLITDLKLRGMLDDTLVIWAGEFGRTPKINARGPKPGRDHYPKAWTSVMAGGGLKTGQVIGRTSADGDVVEERPISAVDFMATVCTALKIDYTKKYTTRDGRPIRIVDKNEKPVTELFA